MNLDLLPIIRPDARIILDFRNNTGDLGLKLNMRNPESCYLGITAGKLFAGKADCLIFNGSVSELKNIKNNVPFLEYDGQVIFDFKGKCDFNFMLEQVKKTGLIAYRVLPYYYQKGNNSAGHLFLLKKNNNLLDPILIQTIIGESLVCARVRITEPHNFLKTLPLVEVQNIQSNTSFKLDNGDKAKVLIRQRAWVNDKELLKKQLEVLNHNNYLTIAEMDDDPLHWEHEHRANDFLAFRGCHAIQVSTPALAEFMRQFNPHVCCFKNQLAYLPPEREFTENEKINIFFGALNREKDWQPLLDVINDLAKLYKDKIRFKVIHDQQFFAALQTDHKDFLPFCDYKTYEEVLHSCHIAILPLEDNHFNRMKSDLKFIECAGHGAAVLASPIAYGDTIVHGRTGYIYHDKYEFKAYFMKLIEDDQARNMIRKNAYHYVKNERLLCQHYRERYEWYQSLYAELTELNRELMERIDLF